MTRFHTSFLGPIFTYKRGPAQTPNHIRFFFPRPLRLPPFPSSPPPAPPPIPSSSRTFQNPTPAPPEKRLDVRPPDIPLPSGPSPPRSPEPIRRRAPQNPSLPRAGPPPRPPSVPAARRRIGVGVGRGAGSVAGVAALDAGCRAAERQPRAPARPRGGRDVGGRALARRVPGGAPRWRASVLVPQHSLGPPAFLRPARPLRPFPRALPRGHAPCLRPQARPQPARCVHGHRHHHHDPAAAAAHVMTPCSDGFGEWRLVC